MGHCKPNDLKDIAKLLEGIRKIEGLTEKSFGCFYIKSKGVLHFHKNKDKPRFAHIWTGKGWIELSVAEGASAAAQVAYLKKIRSALPL